MNNWCTCCLLWKLQNWRLACWMHCQKIYQRRLFKRSWLQLEILLPANYFTMMVILLGFIHFFEVNKISCFAESRNILLANACKHLRSHLTRRDELKLCTEILGEILSFLYKQRKQCEEQGKMNNCIHHDVDTLCISTLDVLIQTILVIIDKDTKVIVSRKNIFL